MEPVTDYIQPQIEKENARDFLAKQHGIFNKKRSIETIELFYLPSYIVDVRVFTKGEHKIQSFCIDAVQGGFAFLQSSSIAATPPDDFKTCPYFLSQAAIEEKAVDEYRRHLLRLGLMSRIKFEIEGIVGARPVYYPFWIGYFHRKGKIDFEVIDALGGEQQGSLMRSVFMKALLNEKS